MGHAEPLTVSIFLPVRGYVPGQTIPLKVNFENSSNIDVKKLRVVLKKVKFITKYKYNIIFPDGKFLFNFFYFYISGCFVPVNGKCAQAQRNSR